MLMFRRIIKIVLKTANVENCISFAKAYVDFLSKFRMHILTELTINTVVKCVVIEVARYRKISVVYTISLNSMERTNGNGQDIVRRADNRWTNLVIQ